MNIDQSNIGRHYQRMTRYFPSGAAEGPEKQQLEPFQSIKELALSLEGSAEFLKQPVGRVMEARRSERQFKDQSIGKEEFTALIWAVQGVVQKIRQFYLRTAPSAGALHPLNLYAFIRKVEHFDPGLYRLNRPSTHLDLLSEQDLTDDLAEALLGQKFIRKASVNLVFTAVADRCRAKYEERAYRYIYMDAGHACQNLYLAATAMGLGCCSIGAFFDCEVDRLLRIDGETETSVYAVSIGLLSKPGHSGG